MKVTFISPYPDITAFGIRTLSACLKQAGHETQLIFLPDRFGDDLAGVTQRYEDGQMAEMVELLHDSDLVGITLMTNFFDCAVQITSQIKRHLPVLVLWGGVHPTIRPEESMEHADMICVGEGEDFLLKLVEKMAKNEDYTTIPNLWVKKGDEIVRNQIGPLHHDLDIYPAPDYSMDNHHVLTDSGIVSLTHELTEQYLKEGTVSEYLGMTGYQTMTSRGCPYSCTYCINDTINEMHGSKKLRWRSVAHVIEELLWVKRNMPYISFIWISDDEFFARKSDDLKNFCKRYKEEIGMPFSCLVSPLPVTQEKMEMLVDAGLVYVQMGIESGSARMQEVYKRKNMNNRRLVKAINIINSFKDKMYPPSYDFLLDAPYETDEDRITTLRFIAEIPKPYKLQPFALILYPGTHLYKMAKKDGLIQDEKKQIYGKSYTMSSLNYLNLLMTFAKRGRFPGPLLKFLVSDPVVAVLNSKPLRPLVKFLYIFLKSSARLVKVATS